MNKSCLELPTAMKEYDFEVNTNFSELSIMGVPPLKSKGLQLYLSKVNSI